jgi:hypothetical protein
LSRLKSSRELLDEFGYDAEDGRRLYCTVRARHTNAQGLALQVDPGRNLLHEVAYRRNYAEPVVSWSIEGLEQRLAEAQPRSVWVTAVASVRGGLEHFHYRFATITGAPLNTRLPLLLSEGTITVDHLIGEQKGKVTEKGPLFKISPDNMPMLFDGYRKVDLLAGR